MVDGKDDRGTTHRPGEGEAEGQEDAPRDGTLSGRSTSGEAAEAALAAARDEARQNHDRWLRTAAELENFKKRVARERTEAGPVSHGALHPDPLSAADNPQPPVQ